MLLTNKTHQDLVKNNSKTSFNGGVRKLEMRENGGRNFGLGVKERETDRKRRRREL